MKNNRLQEKRLLRFHRRLPRGDLLRLAFHEAGHTVAALLLGVSVRYVTIKPCVNHYYEYGALGHCELESVIKDKLTDAIVTVAADIAVEQHLGLADDQHGDLIGEIEPSTYAEARARARELLGTAAAREQVRALAGRLLQNRTVYLRSETDGPTHVA